MAIRPLDLMDPEEAVGNIWHDDASAMGARPSFPDVAVHLSAIRPSLVLLFRALGGDDSVEIGEAPATRSFHRQSLTRKLGNRGELMSLPRFDGERLGLPPVMDAFPERDLNRRLIFGWFL